jgi:1,4-dihydroxy-2-naphthoate octaprenyltransferase
VSFVTLPLAFKVIKGSFRYDEREVFLKAMGQNVFLILAVQALIAVGYIAGGLLGRGT